MMVGSFGRYWHTLRYLRPVQVYGRIWFRLNRPRPDLRPAPALRKRPGNWAGPRLRPCTMFGPAQFRFLHESHPVDAPAHWNDPQRDKLWLYNLHYFDDLNGADADTRVDWHRALIQRWIEENPPGEGNGWEPYPTSLRLVNWVKWALRDKDGCGESFRQSLAVQSRWLRRRLEHHLLGNHLFANAKALVFAGAFFDGAEAERWRVLGQRLLAREMREQILADGGHFERSPMYHAILLEDVLDLLHLADVYPQIFNAGLVSHWRECAGAMLAWLEAMTHPDGEIGFFNDAAFGIAPSFGELARYAATVNVALVAAERGTGSSAARGSQPPAALQASEGPQTGGAGDEPIVVTGLRESGYVRLEAASAIALLDVAPIGPDYLPGHAHADTLSFELSLFGQRVIVNGGTSRYGLGPERLAERGTAAHSTVEIDGQDSSEVWGGFRVARRAKTFDVRVEPAMAGEDGGPERDAAQHSRARAASHARVTAAHDGYRRLPGRCVHRRRWEIAAGWLRVTDRIEGRFDKAVARFHLHPDVEVWFEPRDAHEDAKANSESMGDGAEGVLRLPTGECCRWRLAGGTAEMEYGLWHPEFGRSVPNRCLALQLVGGTATFELTWDPLRFGREKPC